MQPVVAYLIAAVLLALAGFFSLQQILSLRRLRFQPEIPPEDRAYIRQQAWTRLACSILMVLLAVLVAGAYASGLEERALAQRQPGDQAATVEQQRFLKLYGAYWITVLVILMVVVLLAALDMWAIRRYGRRHLLQLQADHKASVEQQLAALRTERNGHPQKKPE
jgi:hypothetical protein